MSKRRRGYPSETRVKRGDRVVHGDKEFIRETRARGPLPMRVWSALSRSAASAAGGSTGSFGTTTGATRGRRIAVDL
jgi:hypothetical protein